MGRGGRIPSKESQTCRRAEAVTVTLGPLTGVGASGKGCHAQWPARAAVTNTDWQLAPDIYSTQLWGRKAPGQGSGRLVPLRPLSLAGRQPPSPVSSHARPCVRVCVLISFPHRDTSSVGLWPLLKASFYLNYLLKGHISKYITLVFTA